MRWFLFGPFHLRNKQQIPEQLRLSAVESCCRCRCRCSHWLVERPCVIVVRIRLSRTLAIIELLSSWLLRWTNKLKAHCRSHGELGDEDYRELYEVDRQMCVRAGSVVVRVRLDAVLTCVFSFFKPSARYCPGGPNENIHFRLTWLTQGKIPFTNTIGSRDASATQRLAARPAQLTD